LSPAGPTRYIGGVRPTFPARSPAGTILLLLLLLGAGLPHPAAAQLTEADVFVAQAIVDFDDKRYEEALANLRRALELEPDHVEALYYSGVVLMAARRPAEAVPFLERARRRAPGDPVIAFQLGLAYFAQEHYDQAEPLLEQAFRAQPTLDGLGYYVGFLRYRKKDYRGALRAFEAGRASDPEIQQLTRLYAGLALAALGLPAQAAAEVERALRLAPGSPVTGVAERLRDAVVAAGRHERRLAVELRFGVFYDDNVRVLPNRVDPASPTADPLVALIRAEAPEARQTPGELVGLRVQYAWWRSADWDATVGYSFFMTYNNEAPDFNITDHLAWADLVYKTAVRGRAVNLGLQYAFDALFLDEDEFLRRSTVTLFGTIEPSRRHLTQLVARYQNKEFNETVPTPAEESRDADNWMVGATHFFRFAEDRHFVKVGYQFDRDDAGRNFEYHGHRILFGAQYTLPWYGIRLNYDLDLHLRDYLHPHSLLPSFDPDHRRRHDTEVTHAFRVAVPLPWSLTLSAEYLKIDNHSNLQVFDFSRNVTSLTLSWSY
jgi:tetratricopeptide (TPR) repeat protein